MIYTENFEYNDELISRFEQDGSRPGDNNIKLKLMAARGGTEKPQNIQGYIDSQRTV